MCPAQHVSRWLITFHGAVLCAGCAKRDAELGTSTASDRTSGAGAEAGSPSRQATEGSTELQIGPGSGPTPPASSGDTTGTRPSITAREGTRIDAGALHATVLDAASDATSRETLALDAAPFDATTADSGRRDRELCERACLPSAGLPCRSEQCLEICLDEIDQPCAPSYRPYLACLASRDASEFACDPDDYVVAPSACSEEEATFVACLRQ